MVADQLGVGRGLEARGAHTHTHTQARSLDASTPTGKLRPLGVLHKKMEGGGEELIKNIGRVE